MIQLPQVLITTLRRKLKPIYNVVAGAIKHKGQIFICQRSETMTLPLKWEFPGGKIEPGETKEDALIREIQEELSCDVVVGDLIDVNFCEYDKFSVKLNIFECKLVNGLPNISEHSNGIWILPAELTNYDFCEADINAVNLLTTNQI